MKVVLSGNQAKLYVNGVYRHQYSYSAAFSGGKVGFRTSKGQAHFDNLLFTNSQTQRSLYALGNQTIATRVSGDPVSGNNGLFYIFSDHLGSTSVLATSGGTEVPGSRATYYPFGSPRTAPTQTITDRNFTGQKENLELGLIYFNARYYLPNLARFLTPDTLVPDPQNPQAFNRYSYVENNPINFVDPSGHCKGTEYENDKIGCMTWLQEKYGIVIDFWQSNDMSLLWALHESLDLYSSLLGESLFTVIFGGKKFNYTEAPELFFGGVSGDNSISLLGNLEKISLAHRLIGITDTYLNLVLIIAHEMAHFIVNPTNTPEHPNGLNGVFDAFVATSGWIKVGLHWIPPQYNTLDGTTVFPATLYSALTNADNPAAEDAAESLALSLVIGPHVLNSYSANILSIVHQFVDDWYWLNGTQTPTHCYHLCY